MYLEIMKTKMLLLKNCFLFSRAIKKYEYITIKRLDEKVVEFLKGENEDGEIYCSNQNRLNKLYHPSDIEVFKKKIVKDDLETRKLF